MADMRSVSMQNAAQGLVRVSTVDISYALLVSSCLGCDDIPTGENKRM